MSRRLLPAMLLCFGLLATAGASASITISGRVLVPGDVPLAEAQVTLTPMTDALTEILHGGSDEPEPPAIRTLTDGAGRYQITAPHAGMWQVRIDAPGFAPLQTLLRPLIEPTVLDDARLSPDAGLTVRVVDPDGNAVSHASVVVVVERGPMDFGGPPWETPRRRGLTAEDGIVRFAHAEHDVVGISVLAAGHPFRALKGRRGTAARVRLRSGSARTLQVVSPDGDGVADVMVALGDRPQLAGITDAEGKLKLVLENGSMFEVAAIHRDGRRASTRLGPPPSDAERPLQLQLPERSSLVGRLIDANLRKAIENGVVWDIRPNVT